MSQPCGTFTPGPCSTKQIGYVDTKKYNAVVKKLRQFFWAKGFLEVHTQSRLSILAACEDPTTIATYNYAGMTYPLPQTGQMWLEYELLRNPNVPGYFCMTTSFRNEPNPVPGRHDKVFGLFELEMKGQLSDLINLWKELCTYLGYTDIPHEINYDDIANKYNVMTLEHEHEERMYQEFGSVVFLKNFPVHTSPFWNMGLYPDGLHAKKVDVILSGVETFGSAERSSNVDEMRRMFHTISDGKYANILFGQFTKERVEKELNEYLSYDMIQRVGGGIGITRLIRSLEMEGLLEDMYDDEPVKPSFVGGSMV
jgi:aspartyl/asparaginyl-tRNA synthetase